MAAKTKQFSILMSFARQSTYIGSYVSVDPFDSVLPSVRAHCHSCPESESSDLAWASAREQSCQMHTPTIYSIPSFPPSNGRSTLSEQSVAWQDTITNI